MKLFRLNKNEQYIAPLEPLSMRRTIEINGDDIIELSTSIELGKGERIIYQDPQGQWHEYIVQGVELIHGSNLSYEIFAESSVFELTGDFVTERRPRNSSAAAALDMILPTSRWSRGTVDEFGLKGTTFYRCSVWEALKQLVEVWGCEINTHITIDDKRITGRYIDLLNQRGSQKGKRFVYSKDMQEIKRIIHRDNIITALYGFGRGEEVGDGFGRRIDFSTINQGKMYVEDNVALAQFGRLKQDGTRAHVFGKLEFDSIEDEVTLLAETQKALGQLNQPRITYEATVVDLSRYGLTHEGVSLGDTVTVIDSDLDIRLQARVQKIVEYPFGESENELVIGNYLPLSLSKAAAGQSAKLNSFSARAAVWDRATLLDSDGVQASAIKNFLSEWNEKMNLGLSGGQIIALPGGFRFENTVQVWAMEIGAAGFRIASGKLADGSWDWKTIGTGGGFAAEMMFAGTVLARIAELGYVKAEEIILASGSDAQTIITQMLAGQLVISESLQHGGINLIRNPTFGGLKTPSVANWVSGYTMQLLIGRFDGKTMIEMVETMNAKTMEDIMNNAY